MSKNKYILITDKKCKHCGVVQVTSPKTIYAIEQIFRETDYQIKPLNIFRKDYQREILVRFTH